MTGDEGERYPFESSLEAPVCWALCSRAQMDTRTASDWLAPAKFHSNCTAHLASAASFPFDPFVFAALG